MATTRPSIAIVGAGPGGLALARLLTLNAIPYTVFELRSKLAHFGLNSSGLSGSLDLHVETGQYALHRCDLWTEFESLLRPDDEETIIGDRYGKVLHHDHGDPDAVRPEIDRADLSRIMRESIPEDNIRWDHKLMSISSVPNNRWHLEFEGCQTENYEFDLVIGADGAWSRVRTAVSETKPQYSNISCITTQITDIDNTQPEIAKQVGNANFWCFGDKKAIMCQRGGHGSVRTYLMIPSSTPKFTYPVTNDSTIDLATLPPTSLLSTLTTHPDLFASWGESLKAIITASSTEPGLFSLKPLWMLPIGFAWVSRTGVTLLGDAAHVMTPFSGEGVNLAMIDAVEIADEIIKVSKGVTTLAQATASYEKVMFSRTKEISQETWDSKEMLFSETSPHSVISFMEEMMGQGGPPDQP